MASRIFLARVRSEPSWCLATCWVMVLPPWTIRPALRFVQAALRMPRQSMPECSQKRRSSMATKACWSFLGILEMGTHLRYSDANSPRSRPSSATTLVTAGACRRYARALFSANGTVIA